MSHRVVFRLFHFVVAVCFLGIITPAHAGEGKPIAGIKVDSYDFGSVFEGADVTHDYIIKNTGDAALEIKAVKSG